jgi:hypothetical protein
MAASINARRAALLEHAAGRLRRTIRRKMAHDAIERIGIGLGTPIDPAIASRYCGTSMRL